MARRSLTRDDWQHDERAAWDVVDEGYSFEAARAGISPDQSLAASQISPSPPSTPSSPPENGAAPGPLMPTPTDTLLASQWHLTGSGTTTINVQSVWNEYRGASVTVGVIDDGFAHDHADLAKNYDVSRDRDLRGGDDDARAEAGDHHGTAVMGVIGADDNGSGTVGVAPDATLVGLRIGYGANGSVDQVNAALHEAAALDIVNCSWSFPTFFGDDFNGQMAESGTAIIDAVSHGREGLGSVFVFAAGNARGIGDNTNHHNFANSIYTTSVASTDAAGIVAHSSTPGASILVAAPGVGILTTDVTAAGGHAGGDHVSVSGTSFAAPNVTGVVALMLDANATLGYRDVQEILAYSADLTDGSNSSWQINHAQNWNGGGMHSSTDYGFGLVDTHDAVRLAETWSGRATFASLDTASEEPAPGLATPDSIAGGLSSTLHITRALDIDKVEIELDLQHDFVGDLRVVLTSPAGTESILIDRPGHGATDTDDIRFSLESNQFWGERSAGDWTLRVEDLARQEQGQLNSWRIDVHGDDATPDDLYVYTDEFARYGAADAARRMLSDSGGDDTINASAVTSDARIDLNGGAVSQIAGQRVTISVNTLIERAYAGDGNDTIIGNDLANFIWGGRGNDMLTGGGGDDRFAFGFHSDDDTISDFGRGDMIVLADGVELESIDASIARLDDGTMIMAGNGHHWVEADFAHGHQTAYESLG